MIDHRLTRENFKIISGGQTGVDRAALDSAIELGIPHGGWCPRGRRAEDGVIPWIYKLDVTPSPAYLPRTVQNVRESTGTLVLYWQEPSGGTARTIATAKLFAKPWLSVDLAAHWAAQVRDIHQGPIPWLHSLMRQTSGQPAPGRELVLNVAGPRASRDQEVYTAAKRYMDELLERLGFYHVVNK